MNSRQAVAYNFLGLGVIMVIFAIFFQLYSVGGAIVDSTTGQTILSGPLTYPYRFLIIYTSVIAVSFFTVAMITMITGRER